eukprot:407974_1
MISKKLFILSWLIFQGTSVIIGNVSDCISAAKPGDTCYIKGGNYTDFFIEINKLNGNKDAPITISSNPGETVVIDGTINIDTNSWTQYKDCIYVTKLKQEISQLFVEYEMMTPCRWPQGALWKDKSVFDYTKALRIGTNSSVLGTMVDDSLSTLNFSVKGAVALLNIFSSITTSAVVTSHETNSNRFSYSYPSSWTQQHFDSKSPRYYLENIFEFLDEETEYYLDTKTNELYLWTPHCKNPNVFTSIRGKQQTFALNISHSSYINVENVTFFGVGMNAIKSDHITLKNINFLYSSYSKRVLGLADAPIAPQLFGCDYLSMINCVWSSNDGSNFIYHGNYGLFYNNLFEYTSYSCIGT